MRILLPIDGSASANEAIQFVCSLAEDNPVDVIVLMVSHDPVDYIMHPWATEFLEQENQRAQKTLAKAKQSLDADCRSVSIVKGSGSVIPCILNQAKKSQVDLIALGAKGHSAVRRILLGSVSDTIATRAECSVLVVRSTGSTSKYVLRHAPCSVWISRHHWKTEVSKQEAADAITAS